LAGEVAGNEQVSFFWLQGAGGRRWLPSSGVMTPPPAELVTPKITLNARITGVICG
jgi:hypothetical protein